MSVPTGKHIIMYVWYSTLSKVALYVNEVVCDIHVYVHVAS